MARLAKLDSWRAADCLRIRCWFQAVLHAFFPDDPNPRSADLDRFFQKTSKPIASSRLSAWKNGIAKPSADWLARLHRHNKIAGQLAQWLAGKTCITENRLENLFLALEATVLKCGRRERCLVLLDQVARTWMPEIKSVSSGAETRNEGWWIPVLGGFEISRAVIKELNPFDRLSVLNYHMSLGTEIFANVPAAESAASEGQEQAIWLTNWGFDLFAQVLLISTLVRKELTEFELYLVGKESERAIWLRDWFLHDGYLSPCPQKLARMLSGMGFEDSVMLASLLISSRKKVFLEMRRYGCDRSKVLALFPDLMPPISSKGTAWVQRALRA